MITYDKLYSRNEIIDHYTLSDSIEWICCVGSLWLNSPDTQKQLVMSSLWEKASTSPSLQPDPNDVSYLLYMLLILK